MKNDHTMPGEIQRSQSRLARFALHVLLPLAALLFGVVITFYLLKTGPKAKPGKRPPAAILVEVQQASPGPQVTMISAMGEIIPEKEIEIKPRVSGEITEISKNFLPGGYFLTGEKMLAIDRADYELVTRQLESDVARAESDLALEMGNQRIAEREYKLLDETVSDEEKNLILRIPQLEKLQAARDYAQFKLAQARLNLERTEIKAPFNGVIVSRLVNSGAKITESSVLAEFVGTDVFWLRLTLPVEQLRWLKIPGSREEQGSIVHIFPQGSLDSASSRKGRVIQLLASLEEQGRMAQLLVRIDDPLCRREENRGKPRLLLGSFVRAEIEGVTIESGISVDRSHIHDGSTVWLMDEKGMLDIRPVEVSFRGRDRVIVSSGLEDGDLLVTSALSSPVEGTALRLKGDDGMTLTKGQRGENAAQSDGKGRDSRVE